MSLKFQRFDKKELIPLTIIVLMFATGIILYPRLPDQMPMHWDAEGNIDGYGSKFTGTFLMPLVTIGLYILFTVIPYIAVYKKNIKSFYFYYFGFKIAFVSYCAIIYFASLLPNFGYNINMSYVFMPLLAVLLYIVGIMMRKSKRNFFIGIRTPWTLSSDEVWDKTHKLGGKMFKVIALITLFATPFGSIGVYILLISLFGFVGFILFYSYYVYKKVEKN